MTIHIAVGNAQEGKYSDWRYVHPVVSTGARVTQDVDTVWIEVRKPVGMDWVLQKDVLATGYDPELAEGRYLYIDDKVRMAVKLEGIYVNWNGEKYQIINCDAEQPRAGELNKQVMYTMVPDKNLYKITEFK